MIKAVTCFVLFVTSAGVGMVIASTLERRTKALQELMYSVGLLQSRLEYYKEPLFLAMTKVAPSCESTVGDFFLRVAELLEPPELMLLPDAFYKAMEEAKSRRGVFDVLLEEDQRPLMDLSERLGADAKSQQMALSLCITQYEQLAEQSAERAKKSAKLYRTSGTLIGALLVLLFI